MDITLNEIQQVEIHGRNRFILCNFMIYLA